MIKYKFVVSLRNWFNFDLWKKRGKFGFKSILRYLTSENLINYQSLLKNNRNMVSSRKWENKILELRKLHIICLAEAFKASS